MPNFAQMTFALDCCCYFAQKCSATEEKLCVPVCKSFASKNPKFNRNKYKTTKPERYNRKNKQVK